MSGCNSNKDLSINVDANLQDYAHIYNIGVQFPISAGDSIVFSNNNIIRGAISHAEGSANINIYKPGIYEVFYYIFASINNQMGLYFNGELISVATVYGLIGADTQNIGKAIIELTSSGVLTLTIVDGLADLGLENNPGGEQTSVNAALIIKRIGDI